MTQMSIQDAIALGTSAHQAGDLARAQAIYHQVLAASPEHPEALHLLGLIELQSGRLDAAADLIQRAIRLAPDAAHFHANLGLVLMERGTLPEAIGEFKRALELQPDLPQAQDGLGNALARQGETQYGNGARAEAIQSYRQALALRPDWVEVLNNLGVALMDLGRAGEAIEPFQRAVALKPDHGDAQVNLGTALRDVRRFEEAMDAYRAAARHHPGWYAPASAMGMLMLLRGDYRAGWPLMEARWSQPDLATIRASYTQPQWRGEPIEGRRIMLHAEQGFGDAIQFIRYVPKLIERGGRVIMACVPELLRLFQANLPGVTQWCRPGEVMPAHDVQSSLMTLPMAFDTILETIPGEVPYLRADLEVSKAWQTRLSGVHGHRKVGLAWAGRPAYWLDRSRSMSAAAFARLGGVAGITFVNLQVGQANLAELQFPIADFTSHLTDFNQTAGLIEQLDLVISIDSAVAHLAGAMGKPVWTLLPYNPDWRWMLDRSDSPWYPTMRLFRQSVAGDWTGPIQQVVQALQEWSG